MHLEGPAIAERWLKPLIRRVLDEADRKEKEEAADEEEEDQAEEPTNDDRSTWHPEPLPELYAAAHLATMSLLNEDDEEPHEFLRAGSVSSTPLSQNSLLGPGSITPKARTRAWGSAPAPSTQRVTAPQDEPFHYAGEPARKASSVTNPSALKFRKDGGPSTIAPTTIAPSFPTPLAPPYTPSPRPTTSSQSPTTGNGFLALFNQLAAQKHIEPVWTTGSSGPAHKPTFDATVTGGPILVTHFRVLTRTFSREQKWLR